MRKKLLVQLIVGSFAFLLISLAILLPVVNHQATQIFLNTKNEQMDREFAAVLELVQGAINSPSLLAYWEAFPEETETLMTDEEQEAIQDRDTMWSFISQSEETVLFSSLGDAEKRYAAHILYASLSEGLSYIMHMEGYDRVALVDIREENLGRIICSDAVEGEGNSLPLRIGRRWIWPEGRWRSGSGKVIPEPSTIW